MKILHVVPTYLPATRYGGPIYSVHGLCRALADLGHDVHVFTTNVDGPGNSDVPLGEPVNLDGVSVWYFPSRIGRRLYWSPALYRALRPRITEFDVVHLHSVFLWPTWAAARLARRAGVPYLLAPRGMLVKDLISRKSRLLKSAWITLIEKRNIEKAAAIHFTAPVEQEEFDSFGFRQSTGVMVPNGVDLLKEADAVAHSPDVTAAIAEGAYLLFLGRINWKKGLDRLIPLMKHVQSHRLLVVGNDEENYLATIRELVDESAVQDRVTVLPRFVSGADKDALYQNADLFVLPSYSENFGNTVVEAMAAGCPVLVTEEVGAADIVARAGGGQVVQASALKDSLQALLRDRQALKSSGETGRKWVEQNLSWPSVARSMESHYRDLLS